MCVCGPFMFTLKHNQKDVAVLLAGAQSVTVGGGRLREDMRYSSGVIQRGNQPSGQRVHDKLGGRDGSDCQGHCCGEVIKKRQSAIWKWATG